MKNNNKGTIPNKHRGAIINGITLDAASLGTGQPHEGNRFYDLPETIVHRLHDNLAKIMTLAQDVFITPLDLVLLDQSHGVIGEGARKEFPGGTEEVFGAEREIDKMLRALTPRMPFIEVGGRVAHFLPALTMPIDRRVEFAQITDSERLSTALETKLVFVYGADFYGYGKKGKSIPDDLFWNCLFGESCDDDFPRVKASAAKIEAVKITEFCPLAAVGFWLDRCVHRDVGHTHLMDQLDLDELCAGREDQLVESIKAIKSSCGRRFPSDLCALKYFGPAGISRS